MSAFEAMMFAKEVHKDQRRKYTNTPYVEHLAEVAAISTACFSTATGVLVQKIAWLHDCIEDQEVTFLDLKSRFGQEVAYGVLLLSDLEKGNRAERKRLSRERLKTAPFYVQTIKVADLISNTSSIANHDPSFAKVYIGEARLLLDVLDKADPYLKTEASNSLTEAENSLYKSYSFFFQKVK